MPAKTDPNLGLHYGWTPGESGWGGGMDTNLKRLGGIIHLSVKDRDLTTPPTKPKEGNRYLISKGASGEWANKTHHIALFIANSWVYHTPKTGWLCFIEDEEVLSIYKSEGWSSGVAI